MEAQPDLLKSAAGVALIARTMSWVADEATHRWLDALADGTWSQGTKARGELIGLRLMSAHPPTWIREAADSIITSNVEGAALGLTHAAVHLWSEPSSRKVATDLLTRLIPRSQSTERAAAVMAVFDRSPRWFCDGSTIRLLDAVIANPGVLSSRTVRFAEQIQGLCLLEPERVAKIAIAFVDQVANDHGEGIANLYTAGPILVDIAVTIQRLSPNVREHGVALFEKLLEHECRGTRELLRIIDQGTGN
jgi:hypothetical protein